MVPEYLLILTVHFFPWIDNLWISSWGLGMLYGRIPEILGCTWRWVALRGHPGVRHWGFVTFATSQQALDAKDPWRAAGRAWKNPSWAHPTPNIQTQLQGSVEW